MKKMILALVVMVMMSANAMAQSENGNIDSLMSLNQLTSYLKLSYNQEKKMKKVNAQFQAAQAYLDQLDESQNILEGVEKMLDRQKRTVKEFLTKKQFKLYVERLDHVVEYHKQQYIAAHNK